MIALLLLSRASAQEPPAEPPAAEPAPESAPPEEEPGWEAVTVEPPPEAEVEAVEPEPEPEQTPPVDLPAPSRGRFLRYELAAEIGSLGNDDPAYDLFSEHDSMGSFGVGLGFNLSRHLAIVGSWHHYRHGATLTVQSSESDADFESQQQAFRSAWLAHQGTLGARIEFGILDVVFPYVKAQGVLLGATMRLDDDPSVNDNPGQVQEGGLTGGVMGTAGFELRFPPQSTVQLAWNLELGHAWLARADFGALGSMQPGGFVARSGLGLRF